MTIAVRSLSNMEHVASKGNSRHVSFAWLDRFQRHLHDNEIESSIDDNTNLPSDSSTVETSTKIDHSNSSTNERMFRLTRQQALFTVETTIDTEYSQRLFNVTTTNNSTEKSIDDKHRENAKRLVEQANEHIHMERNDPTMRLPTNMSNVTHLVDKESSLSSVESSRTTNMFMSIVNESLSSTVNDTLSNSFDTNDESLSTNDSSVALSNNDRTLNSTDQFNVYRQDTDTVTFNNEFIIKIGSIYDNNQTETISMNTEVNNNHTASNCDRSCRCSTQCSYGFEMINDTCLCYSPCQVMCQWTGIVSYYFTYEFVRRTIHVSAMIHVL
jgi:hypothetical protein